MEMEWVGIWQYGTALMVWVGIQQVKERKRKKVSGKFCARYHVSPVVLMQLQEQLDTGVLYELHFSQTKIK